jgi:hypothetical protein
MDVVDKLNTGEPPASPDKMVKVQPYAAVGSGRRSRKFSPGWT